MDPTQLIPASILWSAWMCGGSLVPSGQLVWPPLKYRVLTIFAPIGLILFGVLSSYRVLADYRMLAFGFFPFKRKIPWQKIVSIGQDAASMLSPWKITSQTAVITKKEE